MSPLPCPYRTVSVPYRTVSVLFSVFFTVPFFTASATVTVPFCCPMVRSAKRSEPFNFDIFKFKFLFLDNRGPNLSSCPYRVRTVSVPHRFPFFLPYRFLPRARLLPSRVFVLWLEARSVPRSVRIAVPNNKRETS